MPELSLRSKILLAFSIVLLPMLALTAYNYRTSFEQRSAEVVAEQRRTAQAVAALVDATIDEALTLALAVASDPMVATLDPTGLDGHLAKLATNYPQYFSIAAVNGSGDAVGTSLPPSQVPQRTGIAADRSYFQQVMATGKPAVSEIIIARVDPPAILFVVAAPIGGEDGNVKGAALVTPRFQSLADKFGSVGLGTGQSILLTDRKGTVAFFTALPEIAWELRNISDFAPIRAGMAGQATELRQFISPLLQDARMGAFMPTPKYGWIVGANIREEAALGIVNTALRGQFFAIGAAGLLSLLLTLFASRVLVEPIRQLTKQARALGRGELSRRADVKTGDEIGELAQTFNQMAARLQQSNEAREVLLEEAERRADELNAVIGSVAEGVVIATSDGTITHLNRAGREILGLPADVTAPTTLDQFREADVLGPDERPIEKREWPMNRALRGETFAQQELIFRRPDRTRLNLLISGSAVRDDEGQVIMAVNVFRDITPMRELERQREEFISVVAHDLRNAIAIVAGYAALLQRLPAEQHNTQTERQAVDGILNSVRRLERMVSDLLDASRIEARRLTLSRKTLDLAMLVKAIVQRSAELAQGHLVRVEVHGEIAPVDADADRVEQVLSNLLSNAGKYSYPDTEVLVEVEPLPGEVMVSVTNLGAGIPPEARAGLFTRFHRARAVSEGTVPGLGLGLYIAKGLVEAHGGRLWVECDPGRSTVFRLTLPNTKLAV